MMDLGDIKQSVGCTIVGVTLLLLSSFGVIIHAWTIAIAFTAKGLTAAILSFAFPVIAQIYWGIVIWNATGTLMNLYCISFIAYVLLWVLVFANMAIREQR